jgi:hypothetical protein
MLGDGKERVDTEIRKGRGGKRASYEAFGDPRSDGIGDVRAKLVSRGGVRCEYNGGWMSPRGLSIVANGVQDILGEGMLLISPGWKGCVNEGGKERLIDYGGLVSGELSPKRRRWWIVVIGKGWEVGEKMRWFDGRIWGRDEVGSGVVEPGLDSIPGIRPYTEKNRQLTG